jgi:hypothetical protein
MFASLIIIVFSMLLFLYWFRYTCLLILSTKTTKDYTAEAVRANQLELPKVQATLQAEVAVEGLDGLHQSLARDYALLTSLVRHAAEFQLGGFTVEQRMLMVDYKIMRIWFGLARRFSHASQARLALEEMADIVAHFANVMGERAAARC